MHLQCAVQQLLNSVSYKHGYRLEEALHVTLAQFSICNKLGARHVIYTYVRERKVVRRKKELYNGHACVRVDREMSVEWFELNS